MSDLRYTFPPEHRIYETLRSEVFDLSGAIDEHQKRFAAAIGGRTLNEHGVNLAWQQVTVDVIHSPHGTPLTGKVLDGLFALSMDALIGDVDFLMAVLDVRLGIARKVQS